MENRRSKMTKRLLKEALVELLLEYDVHSISVKMICEKADLNRSTFYLHYETLDSFIEEFAQEEMTKVWSSDHTSSTSKEEFKNILLYILDHSNTFKVLLKSGMYHSYIMKQYSKLDFSNNPLVKQLDKDSYMLISSYTTSGAEAMILYLLDHIDICSIDDLATLLYDMNTNAYKQIEYLSKNKK